MYVELHLVPNGDIVERTELAILFFTLFCCSYRIAPQIHSAYPNFYYEA